MPHPCLRFSVATPSFLTFPHQGSLTAASCDAPFHVPPLQTYHMFPHLRLCLCYSISPRHHSSPCLPALLIYLSRLNSSTASRKKPLWCPFTTPSTPFQSSAEVLLLTLYPAITYDSSSPLLLTLLALSFSRTGYSLN